MNTQPTTASLPARDVPSAIALLVCTGLLMLAVGPQSLLIVLITAGMWYALGTPYAIATGFVVLSALVPAVDTVMAVGIMLAFLPLALLPTLRRVWGRFENAALLTSVGVFGSLTWLVVQTQPVWLTAGTLGLCIALGAYTMHRYELVQLGLVPEPNVSTTED
ncbi:hypothetical protein [Natrialba sp. SSL1]|uniref:hypothetical protein n=1 Tax=Natrialba sp. SSL1 TaxID=1869245 RepID=UPI0008F8BBEC|nr:hypothetical protein [Natrialba sp. SSL1]OIB55765.1 hypothetical protein BBD46_02845 [Natrialba sp. SSL1]